MKQLFLLGSLILLTLSGVSKAFATSDDNWSDQFGLPGISKLDGPYWVGCAVNAIAVSGTNVYVGGDFNSGGYNKATNITIWNGRSFSALGSGLDGPVRAIAVLGNDVFAGGNFTNAGNITVNGLAKWDGTNWSAVGGGLAQTNASPAVYSLAVHGNDLYIGGSFSSAGGVDARNIAKWNGTSFSRLGSENIYNGVNGNVNALAFGGIDLFVGGNFQTAYNSSNSTAQSSNIVRWNGTAWSPLGSGIDGSVYSFVTNGADLFVGGNFTSASGVPANSVAKWNGSSWSALGAGLNGSTVKGLAFVGEKLTAITSQVFQWDGTNWTAAAAGGGDLHGSRSATARTAPSLR